MATFVLSAYFSILGILCVFGLHRFYMTRLYLKNRERSLDPPMDRFDELPRVTIQLPVFNEKFVVQRIIDATLAIDYPRDRLQIQVLDDSIDETVALAREAVARHQAQGIDIVHIHREDRTGFKAGALENGLKTATGDFVAVFDADFIPDKDFLHQTIHFFTDPRMAMVQTRWEHLNRTDSTLTQVEAMMLDAHFVIEHGARSTSGLFWNFNGTGGIWRIAAINDAGGWEHDTLTEDLDLSYRTQLKGWRFKFLPHVTSPAELPEDMTAFKSQQHRWAKGSMEVMLKMLPRVLRSDQPFKVKHEVFFHLTGNIAYLLMIINSLFFVIPSMMLRHDSVWWKIILIDGPLFGMASLSFIYFYLTAQKGAYGTTKGKRRYVPALMAVGIGLGVNNTRAVLEALSGHKTEFVRTPKTGVGVQADQAKGPKNKKRYKLPKSLWGYFEVLIGLMYTAAILWAIYIGNWGSIPFLVLFQNGFLFVGWYTISEQWRRTRRKRVSTPQPAG